MRFSALMPLASIVLFACTPQPPTGLVPAQVVAGAAATPTPVDAAATPTPSASVAGLLFEPLTEEMWTAITVPELDRVNGEYHTAAPARFDASYAVPRGGGLDSGASPWGLQAGFLDTGRDEDRNAGPVFLLGAELPGGGGAYLERVLQRFRPVVNAWGGDARFSTAFAPHPPPPYRLDAFDETAVKNVWTQRWPAVFVSAERREVLTFWPKGERNFVYLTRWETPPTTAPLDADRAYAVWREALTTPGFQAQEERQGHDLFFGRPLAVPAPWPSAAELQPLYEAPARADTTITLRRAWGHTLWELRAENVPGAPCTRTYDDRTCYGLVDADSGAVIRLQHESRLTPKQPRFCPGDSPAPSASAPPP